MTEGEAGRGGERRKYLEIGCEHAGCDDEFGEDEAGHAEGEENWFAGICEETQHR